MEVIRMNPLMEISNEMTKTKMALDVKTMSTEEMQLCLLDILENHYKDLPYRDIIAVNRALLISRGVKFIL
jgi:hypothetical protein